MDLMTRERDRLLHRTARAYGMSFTGVSALCLSVPGAVSLDVYFVCLPLFALLAFFQFRMGRTLSVRWGVAAVLVGLGILVLVASPDAEPPGEATSTRMPSPMTTAARPQRAERVRPIRNWKNASSAKSGRQTK